jgi:glutathione S-transferase
VGVKGASGHWSSLGIEFTAIVSPGRAGYHCCEQLAGGVEVKIVETRMAPNPRRVRIFLSEKGISVPFEEVDLMSGVLRNPENTALNPMQRVPFLVLDDGTVIAETVAICRYFDEQQPSPPLFGTGALGKAQVEMWQRRIEQGLLLAIASVFRHTNPRMAHLEVPQVAAWGEANRPRVLEMLQLLDRRLAESPYVAGAAYSIADITALVAIDFMRPIKLQRPAELVHLDRWYQEVNARPSARA